MHCKASMFTGVIAFVVSTILPIHSGCDGCEYKETAEKYKTKDTMKSCVIADNSGNQITMKVSDKKLVAQKLVCKIDNKSVEAKVQKTFKNAQCTSATTSNKDKTIKALLEQHCKKSAETHETVPLELPSSIPNPAPLATSLRRSPFAVPRLDSTTTRLARNAIYNSVPTSTQELSATSSAETPIDQTPNQEHVEDSGEMSTSESQSDGEQQSESSSSIASDYSIDGQSLDLRTPATTVSTMHREGLTRIEELIRKNMEALQLKPSSDLGPLARDESFNKQIETDIVSQRTGCGRSNIEYLRAVLYKFVDATPEAPEHGFTQGQHILAHRLINFGLAGNVVVDILRYITDYKGLGAALEFSNVAYIPFFESKEILRIMSEESIQRMETIYLAEEMDYRVGLTATMLQLVVSMFASTSLSDEASIAFIEFALANGRPGVLVLGAAILENRAKNFDTIENFKTGVGAGVNYRTILTRAKEMLNVSELLVVARAGPTKTSSFVSDMRRHTIELMRLPFQREYVEEKNRFTDTSIRSAVNRMSEFAVFSDDRDRIADALILFCGDGKKELVANEMGSVTNSDYNEFVFRANTLIKLGDFTTPQSIADGLFQASSRYLE